jgi:hypothetical protein
VEEKRGLRAEIMKKRCYECGKEITFWRSLFHPVLGRTQLVCPDCFNTIDESLEKYRNFILNDLDHGKLNNADEFVNIN